MNQDIGNQTAKSKRDLVMDRLKGRYPDKQYEDDEALFGQINDDYDVNDKKEAREKSFSDLFTKDRRSAAFFSRWAEGGNPVVELVRLFGKDFLEEADDPAKQEEFAKANEEYLKRVMQEQDYEEQYAKNIEESRLVAKQLQQERDLSDEEVDKAFGFIQTVLTDGVLGKFTKQTIEMALDAVNYEGDVAQASQEGEVRGRNAKIEQKLRTSGRSDGTASLAGKNGGVSAPRPNMGVLDNTPKSIWERGNEKRRKA